MAQLLNIENDTVAISNLTLSVTQGQVLHSGNYGFSGDVSISGVVSANSFKVSNLLVDKNNVVNIPNILLANTQGSVSHNGDFTFNNNALVKQDLSVNGTLTATSLSVQTLVPTNGILNLLNVNLKDSSGNVSHTGDYNISGQVTADKINSSVINADTINVNNLVTNNGPINSVGNWTYNSENELNGKGFTWTHGLGQTQLMYRAGGRLWANANIDLAATNTYNIDDIPVLSATSLGGSVTSSRLTSVGTLNSLSVAGDVTIGDFVFVNSTFNRIGIGTEDPSSAIDILDNNVNIIIGSPDYDIASIGTNSNHDLAIVTDNQARITIKNSGEVNFSGNISVNGTITATSIVSDSRINRTQALQFLATKDTTIYGLGLIWTGSNSVKQFVMDSNPDRLRTTENIDLAVDRAYYIDSKLTLSSNTLGSNVTNSSLTSVGILRDLNVAGPVVLQSDVNVNRVNVINGVQLSAKGLSSANQISLTSQEKEIVYGDVNEINIGDISAQTKPVKVFGPVSINVNNPDPSLQFSVSGDVNIGGKRFTSGSSAPSSGVFGKGDICWNQNPQTSSYIGWVCIVGGTPGQWAGFGMIASQ